MKMPLIDPMILLAAMAGAKRKRRRIVAAHHARPLASHCSSEKIKTGLTGNQLRKRRKKLAQAQRRREAQS